MRELDWAFRSRGEQENVSVYQILWLRFLRPPGPDMVTHAKPFDLATDGNNHAREFVTEYEWKLQPQDGP
jgi:hypothetical protein